jgi:hypothetical protein
MVSLLPPVQSTEKLPSLRTRGYFKNSVNLSSPLDGPSADRLQTIFGVQVLRGVQFGNHWSSLWLIFKFVIWNVDVSTWYYLYGSSWRWL